MVKNEDTQQEIRSVVAGRDSEIRRLKADLMRFGGRIDELEQQKAFMFRKFKEVTGQRADALLDQFKATATITESAHDDDQPPEPKEQAVVKAKVWKLLNGADPMREEEWKKGE